MEAIANNKTESPSALAAEVLRMTGAFHRLDVLFGLARQSGIKEFSSSVPEMQEIFRKLSKKHQKLMAEIRIDRTAEFTTNLHSSSDLEELMVGEGYRVPLRRASENRWEISEIAESVAKACSFVAVGRPVPVPPYYMQPPLVFIVKNDYKSAALELVKELKRRA